MELLELHSLTKSFGQNTAVMALDLIVREGQIRGPDRPQWFGKNHRLQPYFRLSIADQGKSLL